MPKKLLYAKTSIDLHTKIQSINAKYQKERQTIQARFQRLSWLDWLKKEALSVNAEALNALRSRMVAHGVKGNTISGAEQQPPSRHPLQTVVDTISKKGTVIIRTGKFTVRENGAKLKIANSNIHENIKEALQIAVSHYGNLITINGTDEFKNQVVQTSVS
jgi:polyhydroxyalkanoate synthesis regulator phasin